MSSSKLKTLSLKGKVFSGKGNGARFIGLPWVRRQIREKLGFDPYCGTLNIRLVEDRAKRKTLMNAFKIDIVPASGFCRGKLFKAQLMDFEECAVVIPEVAGYPEDVIEIVASTNLRERLRLKDGDSVQVEITL